MTYLYNKIKGELDKRIKNNMIESKTGIDANIIKDILCNFRIPKRDGYDIINELENEGILRRKGNKFIVKR